MKKIKYALYVLMSVFAFLFAVDAHAQGSFVVERIEIRGLEHISTETVESYLPIKRGDILRTNKTGDILRTLYKTGFFERISLAREGHTLIIRVTERPTIGRLKISGNSVVPTDKLTSVMKTLEVAEGAPYNPALLEKIKQSLLNQYYMLGRYNARVDIQTSPMSRHRISVQINISEGLIARIKTITIIGNHAFSEKDLLRTLDISTTGLWSFIMQTDRYSEEKLEMNLDKLRSYYLDHGYVRFQIKSYQAAVTPDRKYVYITIVLDEGLPYTIKNYAIDGSLPIDMHEVEQGITIKPGAVFSRQAVVDSEKHISNVLGEKGYLFAMVSLRPDIDDVHREVTITFIVQPGKRTYVRHVGFTDNKHTNDKALRREVVQMEAAPVSSAKLEDSTRRLKMLPFLKDAQLSVNPVPGIDDQVDVNYKVTEDNSAQASFKVGYTQAYGFLAGVGLNQKNFLGTGNTLGINAQYNKTEQNYGIEYTNPYYTEDGISRTFMLNVARVNPGETSGVNNDYTINEYDAGLIYSIPIGQETGVFNRLVVGATYQQTLMKFAKSTARNPITISTQVQQFVRSHGRHFHELDLRAGYTRDSRDRAILPTRGVTESIFMDAFAPLAHRSLAYYMINYSGRFYYPLTHGFIILTKADLAYGDGFTSINDYPIFRNLYAGGINSVRGFEDLTLGARDSNGKAFGGNALAYGSFALIFPNLISEKIRTSAFFDAGNAFSTRNNTHFGGESTNSGPLRYSVGLELDMLTPFGPVELSVAQPFLRRHDQEHRFQIALGANF